MLRILVGGIAGLLVAGFALLLYVALSAAPSAPSAPPKVAVIVGAHSIRAGSLLQPADLASRDVAEADMPAGAKPDTAAARSAMVGAMVRRMLDQGDVIRDEDVLRPGERGFLAAVLQPGTRAVSVAVDAVSGEAGLIWPGDRVDLILTQTIDGTNQSPAHRIVGETVLGDVRVIAVDQQLVQGGQASGLLNAPTPTSRTITLEVTPQDAARIAVATRLGKLQVVLRAAQPEQLETAAPSPDAAAPSSAGAPAAVAAPPSPLKRSPLQPAPVQPAPVQPAPAAAQAGIAAADRSADPAAPVWGGDVSHALRGDRGDRSAEIRLFSGSRPVEAYKF